MAEGYIPVRKGDLVAALLADEGLPVSHKESFAALARLVAAILHFEAHEALDRLKDAYAPLDPETAPAQRAQGDQALAAFETAFEPALTKANFIPEEDAVGAGGRLHLAADLKLKANTDGIREIRYFIRGEHKQEVALPRWFGIWKKKVEADFIHDVIVLVAFKDEGEIKRGRRKAAARLRRGTRAGAVLIKHFRNVAREELISLHPGAQPTMRARDQVILAGPAVAGGVPVALQLWPALTVLFALISVYFGAQGAVTQSQLQQALAALSGLLAVIAFVMRQKMRYEHQALLYQKKFAETVYFRNVANNAGVLDALIGAGEEQDMKEALLAYWILLRAGAPMTKAEIDKAAEQFLRDKFQMMLDFEIGDALAKLERLELVQRSGESFTASNCTEGLAKLDAGWDALFKFAPPEAPPQAAE